MSADIERMPVDRVPIVIRAPAGRAALAFAELWREAQLRLMWADAPERRSEPAAAHAGA